jgi:beta-lactamase class A
MSRIGVWPLFAALFASACVAAPNVPQPRPKAIAAAPRPPVIPLPPKEEPPLPPRQPEGAPLAMAEGIRALWVSYPDRAGVAVVREDAAWEIAFRGGEPMPQQSVSKLWVAVAVMDAVDAGTLRLSDSITVRPSDLTVFSNAMNAKVGSSGYTTTLGELLRLAMVTSDNSANDVLLRKVGGPAAIRAMISAKGLGAIRFGPGEHLLQAGTAGLTWSESYRSGRGFQAARAQLSQETRRRAMDAYTANPPDGAAPLAIAKALVRLWRGELLSKSSTRRLLDLMEASQTGKQRLRGGTPPGWRLLHKTGTGQDLGGRTAGYNDVGLMIAPDGTAYGVAVMIADTRQPIIRRMQLMQGVTATVAANHWRASESRLEDD